MYALSGTDLLLLHFELLYDTELLQPHLIRRQNARVGGGGRVYVGLGLWQEKELWKGGRGGRMGREAACRGGSKVKKTFPMHCYFSPKNVCVRSMAVEGWDANKENRGQKNTGHET